MKRIRDDVWVYAEGGGSGANSSALQAEFRQAFAEFLSKTVLGVTRRPRVVPCGGREQAFDMFCTALEQGKNALLLVDSETPVHSDHAPPPDGHWHPWSHLQNQAGWQKPATAAHDDCHLMAQCMESWFLADVASLQEFFGQGFDPLALPAGPVDAIPKPRVYAALQRATQACKTKSAYGKGAHSFKLLSLIDPARVMSASPWARRFVDELARRKP